MNIEKNFFEKTYNDENENKDKISQFTEDNEMFLKWIEEDEKKIDKKEQDKNLKVKYWREIQKDINKIKSVINNEDSYDELNNILGELILNNKFEAISIFTQEKLFREGVEAVYRLDINKASDLILLTESTNWAAKVIDRIFYKLKPAMILIAWKKGAKLAYDKKEGVYYLADPKVGVAGFHDPDDHIGEINSIIGSENIPNWEYGWNRVLRQSRAFESVKAYVNNGETEYDKHYIKKLAYETLPGLNSKEKIDNWKKIKKQGEK